MNRSDSRAAKIREALIVLIEEHRAQGTIPTSHRFLFYELVVRAIIAKHGDNSVRMDSVTDKELTYLRERGIIEWDEIVDETRSLEYNNAFASVRIGLAAQLPYIRLDPWRPRRRPLILTESRSLAGALRNLASEYRVYLAATNGQCGGFLHTDIGPALVPGQLVLYLGDYDLVGNDIEYNTRRVLEEIVGGRLAWRRIALTAAQVAAHNLPKITKTDDRFLGDAGLHEAVETEALNQLTITNIVRDTLESILPIPLVQTLAREEAERAALKRRLRPSASEQVEEETEEPELTPDLIAIAEEMDSAHWLRQARGKLRRAFKKAGIEPSAAETEAFLQSALDLGVPLPDRSSSRIARVLKGEKSLESLLLL
jgi:hypothetical protein